MLSEPEVESMASKFKDTQNYHLQVLKAGRSFTSKDRETPKALYGSLKENGPHRLMYLNAWSSVSGTAWEELGDKAFSEEVHH